MRNQDISSKKADERVQQPPQLRHFRLAAIGAVVFVAASAFAIQDSPALHAVTPRHAHAAPAQNKAQNQTSAQNLAPQQNQNQESHTSKGVDVGEYGPLISEFAHLATKIQQGVQVPAPRTQSKALPLLPGSTSAYLSIANYGETLYQANQIFNQELQESPVLSDWWQNKVGIAGIMAQAAIEQVHQFTGYLGDEIVISGTVKPKGGSLLVVAEIRKPGLKAFLQQLLDQYGGKNAPVQVLTPQQLLTAKAPEKGNQLTLLVRPDFLVAASDLSTLRSFNAQLNRGTGTFTSSPFGQRLAQAYQGGVGMVLGADLQQLLALRPQGQPQAEAAFQQSGFADLQYMIVSGKYAGGASSSNIELSFKGPRKGIAAWLAAPANLGGLDFVSTNAVSAGAVVLKSPAQMFEDIKSLAEAINPMASAGLAQMEMELKINLKDDLFSKLGGEFAFALEGPVGPTPAWKTMVQVSDPDGLQKTLKQLLAALNEKATDGKGATLEQKTEDGMTYSSLGFFTGPKHQEVDYAFVDGYMVTASTPALLKEAIELHRSGRSLAKSSDFRKLLPQEHSGQASALIFQNSALMMTAMAQQLPPELAQLLQSLPGKNKFSVMTAYGEENAIRATSNSQQLDMAIPLLVAAVAIPNLMRSKTAATEASAAATVRMLNTAESQYSLTYAGYARDLATLGPGPGGNCDGNAGSASHACLIDATLGCASGTWCTHNGFQFSITGSCDKQTCQDYVVVGTPADSNKGGKSFCSTQDMIVRSKQGRPLSSPISVDECQTWNPL